MELTKIKNMPLATDPYTLYTVAMDDGSTRSVFRHHYKPRKGSKHVYVYEDVKWEEEKNVIDFVKSKVPDDFASPVLERESKYAYAPVCETLYSLEQAYKLADKIWLECNNKSEWKTFVIRIGKRVIKDYVLKYERHLPFERFVGVFPCGTSFCNKAVTEYGDYKKIAFVNDAGILSWRIDDPEKRIPKKEKEYIESFAERVKNEFLEKWKKLSKWDKYKQILDGIPYTKSLDTILNKDATFEEKLDLLEPIYLSEYAH